MTICVDQYGNQCDCNEPGAMVAPGQSLRISALMMDSAQRAAPTVHMDDDNGQAAYEKSVSDGWKRGAGRTDTAGSDPQAAYEQRINDAWRRPAADTANGSQSVSRSHVADGDDGQAAYEARTCNAWRRTQ